MLAEYFYMSRDKVSCTVRGRFSENNWGPVCAWPEAQASDPWPLGCWWLLACSPSQATDRRPPTPTRRRDASTAVVTAPSVPGSASCAGVCRWRVLASGSRHEGQTVELWKLPFFIWHLHERCLMNDGGYILAMIIYRFRFMTLHFPSQQEENK